VKGDVNVYVNISMTDFCSLNIREREECCRYHIGLFHTTHLQHFSFYSGCSILDPFANLWMPTLPDRIVVLSCLDERSLWVDIALIKYCVDSYSQEVDVSRDHSLICVKYRNI